MRGHPPADLLVVVGASLPAGRDAAAEAMAAGGAERLMVVGGTGHATDALRDILEAGGRQRVRGRLEAT